MKAKKEQRSRCKNYHATVMKEKLITVQKQWKRWKKYDTNPLFPNINEAQPLPTSQISPNLPIICSNNTMVMAPWHKCGSLMGVQQWNVQLTLGIGCKPFSQQPLPLARHQSYWLTPSAQTINQQETKNPASTTNSKQISWHCLDLHALTEPRAKRGRCGTNPSGR